MCLSSTELTNLIIMRNSSFVEAQLSPTLEGNKLSHIQFQMIKYEDLQWVRRFYQKRHTNTSLLSFTANLTVTELLSYHITCFKDLTDLLEKLLFHREPFLTSHLLLSAPLTTLSKPTSILLLQMVLLFAHSYMSKYNILHSEKTVLNICKPQQKMFLRRFYVPSWNNREKAWDRGPSLAFLKATNQTCGMAGNSCPFSWRNWTSPTGTSGK